MNVHLLEQAQLDFLTSGKEFFQGISAQKIQQLFTLLTEQLGAVEVALKKKNAQRVTELVYVQESNIADLTATVGRRLKERWQPFGEMTVVRLDTTDVYFQAMVKTSSD